MVYVVHCIVHSIGYQGLFRVFLREWRCDPPPGRRRYKGDASTSVRPTYAGIRLLTGEEDFEGAGSEKHEEKFGEAAGTAFGEERDFFVFGDGEIYGFLVPGVVGQKRVSAGGNFAGD